MTQPATPSQRECRHCGRRGTQQFTKAPGGWKCVAHAACTDRRQRRADLLAGARKIPTRHLPGDTPVSEKPHA